MRRLAPLFLVLSLMVASCGSPTAVERSFLLGDAFWLGVGERAVGDDGATAVRFVRVVGDSRCPPEAVCIWAGEVVVEIGLQVGMQPEVRSALHSSTPPTGVRLDGLGYFIELLEVDGGRGAGSDLTKGYRARLRVTGVR